MLIRILTLLFLPLAILMQFFKLSPHFRLMLIPSLLLLMLILEVCRYRNIRDYKDSDEKINDLLNNQYVKRLTLLYIGKLSIQYIKLLILILILFFARWIVSDLNQDKFTLFYFIVAGLAGLFMLTAPSFIKFDSIQCINKGIRKEKNKVISYINDNYCSKDLDYLVLLLNRRVQQIKDSNAEFNQVITISLTMAGIMLICSNYAKSIFSQMDENENKLLILVTVLIGFLICFVGVSLLKQILEMKDKLLVYKALAEIVSELKLTNE